MDRGVSWGVGMRGRDVNLSNNSFPQPTADFGSTSSIQTNSIRLV